MRNGARSGRGQGADPDVFGPTVADIVLMLTREAVRLAQVVPPDAIAGPGEPGGVHEGFRHPDRVSIDRGSVRAEAPGVLGERRRGQIQNVNVGENQELGVVRDELQPRPLLGWLHPIPWSRARTIQAAASVSTQATYPRDSPTKPRKPK